MDNIEYATFVRKPFKVKAIEITKENIGEIAEGIGELRQTDKGIPYISVNRRLVPNIFRAYIGFWVTVMGEDDNVRCLSRKTFFNQFVPCTEEVDVMASRINIPEYDIEAWVAAAGEEAEEESHNIFDDQP
jgi:hypothetical protein